MKLGSFMETVKKNYKLNTLELRKQPPLKGISRWEFRYIIAEMTETIEYGCDYSNKQICNQAGWNSYGKGGNKCCCGLCYTNIGYLHTIESYRISEIASYFKPNIGFWRADGGCTLPRAYRSCICINYRCRPIEKAKGELSNRDQFVIDLLTETDSNRMETVDYNKLVKVRKNIYDAYLQFSYSGPKSPKQQTWKLIERTAKELI